MKPTTTSGCIRRWDTGLRWSSNKCWHPPARWRLAHERHTQGGEEGEKPRGRWYGAGSRRGRRGGGETVGWRAGESRTPGRVSNAGRAIVWQSTSRRCSSRAEGSGRGCANVADSPDRSRWLPRPPWWVGQNPGASRWRGRPGTNEARPTYGPTAAVPGRVAPTLAGFLRP